MTSSLALLALLAIADQAPPAEPPAAPPAAEPAKEEVPVTAEPVKDAPPADTDKEAEPVKAPDPVKAAEPAKAEEPAKPKDEKLALTLGDLRVAPRAHLRVRAELTGDKTLNAGYPLSIFTHRARAGFDAEWKDTARFVFEMQDVRGWGAEQTAAPPAPQDVTLFGKVANSIDLHQAYAGVFIGPAELKVGRQEIVFANERLLGAVDWAQQGRSFDAIALASRGPGDFGYLAFCSLVRDRDHLPGVTMTELALCGGGVEHKIAPFLRYAPLVMVEMTDSEAVMQRATLGVRLDGAVGGFSYDVDAYGQSLWVGRDIKGAWLAGARAAYELDTMLHPKVGALVDVTSGGDPATDGMVTFDTTYGTNHKFYGFQDLFTNLPVHTQNRGLLDVAGNLSVKEGPFSSQLAVHAFAPTAYDGPGTAFYGIEPDLVGKYDMTKFLSLQAGASLFVPIGDALGRGDQTTPWLWAALDVKL